MIAPSLGPTTEALEAYVARGRARLLSVLPTEKFDAPAWATAALAKTSASWAQTVYFTRHGSTTEALPPVFADVAKAWLALQGGTASRMSQRAFAARWLWRGIEQRLGADAGLTFHWADFRHADVLAAEQIMLDAQLSLGTIYKAASTMADLVRELALSGVGPAITYTPITSRQHDSNNHRVDDPDSRGANVLSPAAVAALADIFHRATSVRDKFYSAQMALLVATGMRWNESVTLPLEPLEEQEVEARDVTGVSKRVAVTFLRRHKAKSKRAGGSGRPNTELQPLTAQQAELARMAVARLRDVCAAARAVAARLERTAPRWAWPFAAPPEYLSKVNLVTVLGVTGDIANVLLREIGEMDPGAAKTLAFPIRRVSLSTLEGHLSKRQEWGNLIVVKPTGGRGGQRASESLLCIRVNELHTDKATLPLIDRPSHAGLERWLEGNPDQEAPSVFERFADEHGTNYREPDGSPVKIDSHMCRRLFVTSGLTAGATTLDMARWQGREHIGDLSSYDQRSMAEKVELVKDAIVTGRLRGQVAQAYVTLANDVRDSWLEGQVQAMHVTPLGLCIHDFSATPCPLALNCLKGCKDYLHDPADQGQVHQLVQLQRRTRDVLELMAPELQAGKLAPAWVEEHQRTLENVTRILEVDAPPDGGLVRPFADHPSRFRPVLPEA